MPYRFLEHTADVGIEVAGATLPELFSEALRGMTDVMTEVESVEPRLERHFELAAEGLDLLLLELLSEALYRFEVDQELFCGARLEIAEEGAGWRLKGSGQGEALDPARHPMKVMLKAVTYHQLRVERRAGDWQARVIFDI